MITQVTPVAAKVAQEQLLILVQRGDSEAVAQCIDQVLTSAGYAKEIIAPASVNYGRGSKAGKLLIGGLSDRNEFRLEMLQSGELVLVRLSGVASAVSSGMLGISKMRKELAQLSGVVLSQLGPAPAADQLHPQALGSFAALMSGANPSRTGQWMLLVVIVIVCAVVGGIIGLLSAMAK